MSTDDAHESFEPATTSLQLHTGARLGAPSAAGVPRRVLHLTSHTPIAVTARVAWLAVAFCQATAIRLRVADLLGAARMRGRVTSQPSVEAS